MGLDLTNGLYALDFETTGVNPLNDRIVTWSLIHLTRGGRSAVISGGIIDPGVPIPKGASDIHGITDEVAVCDGVRPVEGITELHDRLTLLEANQRPLVIFNAPFDWTLYVTELERHTDKTPVQLRIIDSMLLDRVLDKWRKGRRNLEAVCAHYGLKLDDAHTADADAIAAAQIAIKLAEKFDTIDRKFGKSIGLVYGKHKDAIDESVPCGIPWDDLVGLHEFQQRAFVIWRDGINAWWESKKMDNHIDGGWPHQLSEVHNA